MNKVPSNVNNPKLYLRIKEEVKNSVHVWPSAYASGMLVRRYKADGGTYSGSKPSKSSGLSRWFEEKWVDVCAYPKIRTCGRPKGGYENYARDYPYCRPLKRITRSTPKTVKELSASERKKYCLRKRKNPSKRMNKA